MSKQVISKASARADGFRLSPSWKRWIYCGPYMRTRSLYLAKLEGRAVQIMKGNELQLDIAALTMIAGYAHWIPITQGLYLDFFQDNYPGWEWNDIIPVLIKKSVVNINSKEPGQRMLSQGLSIALNVEGVSLIRFKNRITVSVHIIE